ncbi:His/Gly/Thr/Pro-type tRNA ligase C-terminal domain-containing protein [Nocardia seriolae]|uniref:His/Gly/Thr/Pro-type tRNA ligase C-terminal domain-containing protein n=1 Tax=Nocardia seriolae TaxID=37332 RepID=UPI001191E72A|nr:His/Gly/Thr/Pro-type tRNA ligase C-terminal domain-containing protein [Nocardia seriolae]WNJ59796.1 His/Gly/Thr/Pro-type tRNA ligase C-terminal domain-containing protein [Nocardia seriolae]BEK84703.1 hypothetical protein NSERKGN1266_06540 [Nocardia seriolae]GEM24498.1 hypothetical protein NS2_27370 [Nocardia seriolae NBRC 15557]
MVVLPVSEAEAGAAAELAERCLAADLRVDVIEAEAGSLGARIRENRLVPYQFVLGPAETANGEVAVRLRDGRRLPAQPAERAVGRVRALIESHDTRLWTD